MINLKTNKWKVIYCHTDNKEHDELLNNHMFFAIIENGKEDCLFIATKFGAILSPPFTFKKGIIIKLNHKEKLVWTSSALDGLLDEGIMVNLGDIIPKDSYLGEFHISEVFGTVK